MYSFVMDTIRRQWSACAACDTSCDAVKVGSVKGKVSLRERL